MYASLRSIRKVIIFDKISQKTEDQTLNSFDLYFGLINYYLTFCNELPGLHPVEIHVFFDINDRHNELPGLIGTKKIIPPQNANAELFFHCTNIEDRENEISTKWVQDVIIPITKNKWYYLSGQIRYPDLAQANCISKSICDTIKYVFPDVEMIPLEKRCDGGNMLLGKYADCDYLIIGWGNTVLADDQELRKIFENVSMRIFRIPRTPDVPDEIYKKLIHLDMYLTIIGSPVVPLYPKSELLFIGEAEGWSVDTVNKFNVALNVCTDYIIGQQSPLYFHVVRIPLLIIQLQGEYFALSYNNCHVENVEDDNGRRSIHIYFPDYLMRLEERVKAFSIHNKPNLLALRHEIRFLMSENDKLPSTFNAGDLQEAINKFHIMSIEQQETFALETITEIRRLIRKTEKKLVKICEDLGFDGVHFIASDLFALSKTERGSLHCMSLVIDRE